MKQFTFVAEITSKAQWTLDADTLDDAKDRFLALRQEGEPPEEEEVMDMDLVAVLEDGKVVETFE